MSSPLAKAASLFLKADARRRSRPQMPPEEKIELIRELHAITGIGEQVHPDNSERAERGKAAVDLFGYEDTFDENAANVVADIMHALEVAGHSPLKVIAHARAYYFQEVAQENAQKASR